MTNLDKFNPLNRDHLREFEHLAKTGAWSHEMVEFFGVVEFVSPIAFYGKIATVLTDLILHDDCFSDIELP
jgi:hypothetical protein